MAQALFIQTEDISKFTAVNGNLDTDKFIQFVKIAQDIEVQRYLGSDLFEKINNDIVSQSLQEPYLSLVKTYIKPMLIHWSMVHFLPFASYTVANGGVFKHQSENSTSVDKNEVDFLVGKSRDTAEHYTQRLLDHLCKFKDLYPEYSTNTEEDIKPETGNWFSGWVL